MTTHFFLNSVFSLYRGYLNLVDFSVKDGSYIFTFEDTSKRSDVDFYFPLLSYLWFRGYWHFFDVPYKFSLVIPFTIFNTLDEPKFSRYLKHNSSPF